MEIIYCMWVIEAYGSWWLLLLSVHTFSMDSPGRIQIPNPISLPSSPATSIPCTRSHLNRRSAPAPPSQLSLSKAVLLQSARSSARLLREQNLRFPLCSFGVFSLSLYASGVERNHYCWCLCASGYWVQPQIHPWQISCTSLQEAESETDSGHISVTLLLVVDWYWEPCWCSLSYSS